ncbi:MAG: pyridoxamine 5'-phosphate oxidase family protein [Pseudonocardiaceae bacterium]
MTRKHPFDVDAFLAKPLVARVANNGPAVRPVWYLWEDGAFWWITGSYARLPELLAKDPRVALVIDTCDLKTLEVLQVTAWGEAEVVPFDEARAMRKLVRYLGDDEPPGKPALRSWKENAPTTRPSRRRRTSANPRYARGCCGSSGTS